MRGQLQSVAAADPVAGAGHDRDLVLEQTGHGCLLGGTAALQSIYVIQDISAAWSRPEAAWLPTPHPTAQPIPVLTLAPIPVSTPAPIRPASPTIHGRICAGERP